MNTYKLIKDDYIGLKTGWTNEAGLTFIGLNQTNNRNILTIVNKSIVNENKDNHFIDTKILYKESIEDFDKISVIDKDQDIYQVRNSSKAKILKKRRLKLGGFIPERTSVSYTHLRLPTKA